MAENEIRFIDSNYRDLFHIPDGGRIKITLSDGEELIRQCKYIDAYHFSTAKVGHDYYGDIYHICQFAEIWEMNGSTYEPVIENEYRLENLSDEEINICTDRNALRNSAATISGNYGRTKDRYFSRREADNALFTKEFHSELCEVMNYFRTKSDMPILKSGADMINVCNSNIGFKADNGYTMAHYYKISTENNTYFLCCMPEFVECPFFIYGYENKQLERLKDIMFAEKKYGNIEADKFFKTDEGFTEMFYNPDANAGGQIVVNEITNALIKEAAQFKTADAFFEHINDGCNQSLIDAGTPAFRRTVKELVESKADLEGINKDTMKGLIKATGIKQKSQDIAR